MIWCSIRSGREADARQQYFDRHIKPAARKLGLDWVNWLVLRRSYATWLRMVGTPGEALAPLAAACGEVAPVERWAPLGLPRWRRARAPGRSGRYAARRAAPGRCGRT